MHTAIVSAIQTDQSRWLGVCKQEGSPEYSESGFGGNGDIV